MKTLYEKFKDKIAYLFWGVCTTGVNVVVYWLLAHALCAETMQSTIIAWLAAVLFAYVTNRKWVFESNIHTLKEFIHELISFFFCRLATGVLDWMLMYVFVELLLYNDTLVKILSNIIVVVLNYIMSKIIVFKTTK